MIRILHVVTYMGRGGLETMLMNYYRNIDRTKVQFDFLVHRDFRADYDDEIKELGGIIHRVSKLNPWNKSYIKELDTFFKAHNEYKIIHVHQDCLSSIILRVANDNAIPIRIAHSHNSSQDKNLKYLLKLYYKRYIPKYATDLFSCGEKAGKWMFNTTDFKILNNAIDTSQYIFDIQQRDLIRREFNIPSNSIVIGHIGRFAKAKNHTFLLDIFAEFKKLHDNSYLILIGDGQLRDEITTKINTLKLQNSVILTGIRDDVHSLLQSMDIFVMPSLYEGLPVSLIEAQASGLPCIICDHFSKDCDITDLITRLSLNNTADQWADQISKLLNNKRENKLNDIINAGYDIKENAKWLENYYINKWSEIK